MRHNERSHPVTLSGLKAHHTIEYDILNMHPEHPPRKIDVHATHDELIQLADEGFLVRENLFTGKSLQCLRAALDRIESEEYTPEKPLLYKDFGGFTIMHLMEKDEAFLNLMHCEPLVSVAHAMMGPQVQMQAAARITYPGKKNQRTIWHHHLRYIPKPLPPWFMRPHCMNVLLYLDDVTDENGPLGVVPGSHQRYHEEPSKEYFGFLPGEVTLYPTAGTAIFMHSMTWHIARPTTTDGTKRRLIIMDFFPTWLKRRFDDMRPKDGLTSRFVRGETDELTLELLGRAGYM